MIALPPIPRAEMDAWPIEQLALAPRSERALVRGAIQTVAQLRLLTDAQLLRLPAFGARSLRDVREFLAWSERAETGAVRHENLQTFLQDLLSASTLQTLERRYGMREHQSHARRPGDTLRAAATAQHCSCEYIRQTLLRAHRKLRSRPAQKMLHTIALRIADSVGSQGGAISRAQLSDYRHPALGTYVASGALRLLAEHTQHVQFRHGFVSFATRSECDRIEKTVGELLTGSMPLSLEEIAARMTNVDARLIRAFLTHLPRVGETREGKFYQRDSFMRALAAHMLTASKGPLHYRRITDRHNEQVQPRCQILPRQIIPALRTHPRIERLQHGFYRLAVE